MKPWSPGAKRTVRLADAQRRELAELHARVMAFVAIAVPGEVVELELREHMLLLSIADNLQRPCSDCCACRAELFDLVSALPPHLATPLVERTAEDRARVMDLVRETRVELGAQTGGVA